MNHPKKQEEGEDNAREKNGEPETYSRQPPGPQPQGCFPPSESYKQSSPGGQPKTDQYP
jgi:hypothetical protein